MYVCATGDILANVCTLVYPRNVTSTRVLCVLFRALCSCCIITSQNEISSNRRLDLFSSLPSLNSFYAACPFTLNTIRRLRYLQNTHRRWSSQQRIVFKSAIVRSVAVNTRKSHGTINALSVSIPSTTLSLVIHVCTGQECINVLECTYRFITVLSHLHPPGNAQRSSAQVHLVASGALSQMSSVCHVDRADDRV